jgi:hypothetical protein
VFQDGTKKKFQTLYFLLLKIFWNSVYNAQRKKNFLGKQPPKNFRQKDAAIKNSFWWIPKKILLQKSFLKAEKLFLVKIKKNYTEEEISLSAPEFWPIIFKASKKIFSTEENKGPSFKLIKENHQEYFFRFPFNNFKYYLTLLSKFFSSFLHSTFSLSVFCQYLAFGELHHQFWAVLSNNSTLRKKIFLWDFFQNYLQGYHLLWRCFPADFNFGAQKKFFLNATIHLKQFPNDFKHELFHFHSQLLMKS